jgi:hypothetical protein
MFNEIIHPHSGKKTMINNSDGKHILNNYLNKLKNKPLNSQSGGHILLENISTKKALIKEIGEEFTDINNNKKLFFKETSIFGEEYKPTGTFTARLGKAGGIITVITTKDNTLLSVNGRKGNPVKIQEKSSIIKSEKTQHKPNSMEQPKPLLRDPPVRKKTTISKKGMCTKETGGYNKTTKKCNDETNCRLIKGKKTNSRGYPQCRPKK